MIIDTAASLGISVGEIIQFYRNHWLREIILLDEKFYRWQFTQSPSNAHGIDNCVIAYDEGHGNIAGIMGLSEHLFFMKGDPLKAAALTTWVINPEYRGLGIGVKMIQYLQNKYSVLLGMGVSGDALPIYMKLGLRLSRQIPRFIKILNFENIKAHCKFDRLGEILGPLWEQPIINGYKVKEASFEDINRIFNEFSHEFNMCARSADELKWRYLDHPYFSYDIRIVNTIDEKQEALVVLRTHVTSYGFTILHVMDLFGDDGALDAARSFIEDFAVFHRVDIIDFYCTASSIYKELMANQWFSISDDKFIQFPHLFSPLEFRDPPTTSLLFWAKNRLKTMADISHLYITKCDADLDRPTLVALD